MLPGVSPRDSRISKALALAALVAAFLVICLYATYGIQRSLWLDEANTVHIAQGTPEQVVHALSIDVSPPLFYWLLSAWMHIAGTSEIALRIPSIFFYLAAIAAVGLLGRMLLGKEGGWLAAFLYAISPVAGRQAQNVRMYSMLAFVVALSAILFLLLQDPKRRTVKWLALFGLVALIGLNTHYWFGFVLFAYACWVLIHWRSWTIRDLLLLFAFTALPFALLDLPFFLHQARLASTAWTPRPTLATLLYAVSGMARLDKSMMAALLALVLVIGWGLISRSRSGSAVLPPSRRNWVFPAFLYAVSLGVPFLVSFKRPIFWPGRYDIIALPFLALLLASLLLHLSSETRTLCLLILAATCSFYFARTVHASERSKYLATLDPAPLGDADAARAICSSARPGDFVVYTGLSEAAVDFYLERFGCANRLKRFSWPAEFHQHLGWQDPRRRYSADPALQSEAERLVAEASAAHARVFLLFNSDPRLSKGIVSPLEQDFRLESSRRFESCRFCFQQLRLYVLPQERAAR